MNAVALAGLALGAAAAEAETRPPQGGAIVVPLYDQPVAPGDPLRAARWSDQIIAAATAEGLYRDGRPALADGDPQLVSPLVARVRVRPGAKSHDGRPVGAAEIAAALDRLGKRPGLGFLLGPVREAHAAAPDLVELQLSRPASAAEIVLVLGLPQAAVPRAGPFVLAQTSPQEVRLEAYAGYARGRPYLDRVILRSFATRAEEVSAFEVGTLALSLHGPTVFGGAAPRPEEWLDAPTTLLVYVGLLPGAPPEARRALPLVLDREAVRRFAARGPSVTVPGPPQNAPAARALFAGSAWRGRTLVLLCDRSRFEDEDVAQKVQAQLERVGVAVRIEKAAPAEFERRVAAGKDVDLYVGLCVPPHPDPSLSQPWIARCGADVAPLYRRSLRAHRAAELRGVRFDAAARLLFDDAFLWRRPPAPARSAAGG